ncbi:hypothetical protein FMEXI_90 [Fusarium mexicanum]|uniref:DUF7702 domain-containing protein n=1 Tax=Fusarium mexicanum TaxID=751941 RepID=A0A8H5JQV8_9HYPO|nr:hypothetical protein FMEXI_90 [Fusarium mexicanum]
MSTSSSQPPSPPTTACIGLSATALIVFTILLFPAVYVAYKHRKVGKAWFPPFIIFFIFRITSEIYYLSRRNEPDIPTAYAMVAAAASTATLSVTIIGIIYEALNLPLFPYKRQRNRIALIAMNVVYNIGTILSAYGGMRDTTMPDNIKNGAADKAGNIIMFLVMIGTLVWLYPAGKHIYYARQDISYRSAEVLMMAAAPATVLQLIRMNYDLIYSFTQIAMLHPTTGSFAIRFVTFSLQLAIVGMVIVAGWFSKDVATIRARVLKTDSTSECEPDIIKGSDALIELLISHGADVFMDSWADERLLVIATRQGQDFTVEMFLEASYSSTSVWREHICNAITVAAKEDHETILASLMKHYRLDEAKTQNKWERVQQSHFGDLLELLRPYFEADGISEQVGKESN